MSTRDQRALMALGVMIVVFIPVYLWRIKEDKTAVVPASDSVPFAEKRLARVRQLAAMAPGKEEVLKQVTEELAQREKGLIQADTAPQAQAQVLQVMRRLARSQVPPLEIRSTELGQPRLFGQDYGEVLVAVVFDCRIEQLLNLLSDLSAVPELISANELRITSSNPKEKLMMVRLMVSGIVPKKLVPEKKGLASF